MWGRILLVTVFYSVFNLSAMENGDLPGGLHLPFPIQYNSSQQAILATSYHSFSQGTIITTVRKELPTSSFITAVAYMSYNLSCQGGVLPNNMPADPNVVTFLKSKIQKYEQSRIS